MKVIYIAGKYTGKTHGPESYIEIERNILVAREYAIKVMTLGNGKCIALTPHLNSSHMECDFNRMGNEFWYKADIEMMLRCDAVFLLPNWTDSTGAKLEREAALKAGLPVFEDLAELSHYLS